MPKTAQSQENEEDLKLKIMNNCFLSLGSNQKSPERQLRLAIREISFLPKTRLIQSSSFYWTKAWGVTAQQDFCNAVVCISTTLTPLHLLDHCQNIENKLGRIRRKKWAPRIIDIDILVYKDYIINHPRLKLPHPFMLQRDFVLTPLEELGYRPSCIPLRR